jgi:hypothetical protein
LVKEQVFSTALTLLPLSDSRIEVVACRIVVNSAESLGVLCVYRPPDSTACDNLAMLDIIDNFLNQNFKFNIIVGDFNLPDINWLTMSAHSQSKFFFEFCQDKFLKQHVKTPTRRVSNSILDLVLSSEGTEITNLIVNEEFGTSDHSIIQMSVQTKPTHVKRKVKRRDFSQTDWSRLATLLPSSQVWQDILSTMDVDRVWSCFITSMKVALDTIAPFKYIPNRNFLSSSKVRTALRYKRRCFRTLMNNPTNHNLVAYQRAKIIANRALQKDLADREDFVTQNPNPRIFWAYVNRRLLNPAKIKSVKHLNNEVQDSYAIANIFNEYFVSIFNSDTTIRPTSPAINNTHCSLPHLDSIALTIEEVAKTLKGLPSKASTDLDNLSYKILKAGRLALVTYLTDLFSLSLNLGQIPSAWKTAVVTPIHKRGSRSEIKNYRPVSVTSCCLRVLERIINKNIQHFLSSNNALKDSQHGFRSGRSTDTILLNFYDNITDCVDRGLVIDSIFFDFSKAFDSVPHDVLMSRLYDYGIQGNLLQWIHSFLFNRTQTVRIGDCISKTLPVTSGVIQGSILGPTFFNMFVNAIDESVNHAQILKYADDIRLFLPSLKNDNCCASMQAMLQSDINGLSQWAIQSGLSFNIEKCFSVSFGRSSVCRHYSILGSPIPLKESFNDLGVTVQCPVNFNLHVDKVVAKAFSKLGLINKIFRCSNKKNIVRLYKSFIRPIVEYSSIIWCPYTSNNINKIERVQKRMCRMLPNLKGLSYQNQLRRMGLLSLQARRLRYQLITIYKMHHGVSNVDIGDFFTKTQARRTRGHCSNLMQKYAKNNYRLNFFTVSSISLWNKLTQEAVNASSLTLFKNYLVGFFKENDIW